MLRFMLSSAIIASFMLLSACGGSAEDNKVTETRMDDLDSLEGTISDDMINTDQSTDEAPVDAAPPADGAKPKVKKDDKSTGKSEEPAAPKTDDKAETE
jgi:hypothetical protein